MIVSKKETFCPDKRRKEVEKQKVNCHNHINCINSNRFFIKKSDIKNNVSQNI